MRWTNKGSNRGNHRFKAEGYSWDSKKEYARYQELKLLEKSGQIQNLIVKPKFELVINGVKVGKYTPDFQYEEINYTGTFFEAPLVEDVKGYQEDLFKFRLKVFKALYPEIEVRLT